MSAIRAVYENGVFRPLGPVKLPEGSSVELIVVQEPEGQYVTNNQISDSTNNAGPLIGEEFSALLDQVAFLPYTPHPDGRTDVSAHHDVFLYAKQA